MRKRSESASGVTMWVEEVVGKGAYGGCLPVRERAEPPIFGESLFAYLM